MGLIPKGAVDFGIASITYESEGSGVVLPVRLWEVATNEIPALLAHYKHACGRDVHCAMVFSRRGRKDAKSLVFDVVYSYARSLDGVPTPDTRITNGDQECMQDLARTVVARMFPDVDVETVPAGAIMEVVPEDRPN